MSLSLLIIGLTMAASIYGFQNESFLRKMLLHPYTVARQGEYWRFVSAGFVHVGWSHLLFNMLTFFFFGPTLERYLSAVRGPEVGGILFLLLYVGATVACDIPSYRKHKSHSWYSSLGASGGVSAVVFASILISPSTKICLYFILCLPGLVLGLLYLLYSAYMAQRSSNDGINHEAHFYGALFGVVFLAVAYPPVLQSFWAQVLTLQF